MNRFKVFFALLLGAIGLPIATLSAQGLMPDTTRESVQLWLTPSNLKDLKIDLENMNTGLMVWKIGRTDFGTTKNSECGYTRIELLGEPKKIQGLYDVVFLATKAIEVNIYPDQRFKVTLKPYKEKKSWVEQEVYLGISKGSPLKAKVGAKLASFKTYERLVTPGVKPSDFIAKGWQPMAGAEISVFAAEPRDTVTTECTNCGGLRAKEEPKKTLGFSAEVFAGFEYRGAKELTGKKEKFQGHGVFRLRYIIAETQDNGRIESPGWDGLFIDFGYAALFHLPFRFITAVELEVMGKVSRKGPGATVQLNVHLGNFAKAGK